MLVTNQTAQDYWFGPLHLAGGVGQTLTVDDTTATSLYLTDDQVADALNNLYNAGKVTVSSAAAPFPRPTGVPQLLHGDGSPEGLVYAPQGSLYMRRDAASAGGLYLKTTGITVNTGWQAYTTAVATGGFVSLYDSGYLGSAVASIDSNTFSTAFNHLAVFLMGRTSKAATLDTISMQVNGDTGTNYNYQNWNGSGGASGQTAFPLSYLPGASETANFARTIQVDFPFYSQGTFYHNGEYTQIGYEPSDGASVSNALGLQWLSTSAINRIKVTPASAANFVVGSRMIVYGYN
jgi:hypothetical protein